MRKEEFALCEEAVKYYKKAVKQRQERVLRRLELLIIICCTMLATILSIGIQATVSRTTDVPYLDMMEAAYLPPSVVNNLAVNQAVYELEYEQAPEWLKSYCRSISFVDLDLKEKYADHFSSLDQKISAVTVGGDIEFDISMHSDSTMYHELWHTFDWGHEFMSENDDFVKLYDKYKDTVAHSEISPHKEFFASCGSLYMRDRKQLPEEVVRYFDHIIWEELHKEKSE